MIGRHWAPSHILSGGLTLGLLLFLIAISLSMHVPWLGITTEPGAYGVRVIQIDTTGPLAGKVHPGDEILSLRTDQGRFRLQPQDALAEPDDLPTFTGYNRFFERQRMIWQAIHTRHLSLEIGSRLPAIDLPGNGSNRPFLDNERRWITAHPEPTMPPTALPRILWYQVLCGLAILWLGISAWAYVQTERGPLLYAVAGTGMAIAIIASAVYTSRELTLHPDLFLILSRLNQFGAMTFAGAATALLWYYPTRLGRFRFERFMVPTVALILACNWGQWIESLDIIARYTLLLWALLDVVFAAMQWHRTRLEPVERARLKWFVYAWFAGVIGYLSVVVIPQIFDRPALLVQEYAWGLFVFSYLGIALGIIRFRLFDLDRWILMGWFWFACGIFVLALDAFLILWLDVASSASLLITLAAAGWIYFPVRQAFLQRFRPKTRRHYAPELLPALVRNAFDASLPIEAQWDNTLVTTFQPLQTDYQMGPTDKPQVIDNGLRLSIPLLCGQRHLILSYAQQGHRLFDKGDLDFVDNAHMLFSYARDYRRSFKAGVMTERERVARDLHDDVGARLLSVIYRADDSSVAQLARDCLKELRDVIQGLQKQSAPLEHSVRRWQGELGERCDLFGLKLAMTLEPQAAGVTLNPRAERNLERIVREFLTNTIKHADASRLCVTLSTAPSADHLMLECADNGRGIDAEALERALGLGLYGIRERCEELNGHIAWFCPLSGGTGLRCTIPLKQDVQM